MIGDVEFVQIWNAATCAADAAIACGQTLASAGSRAHKCRKSGLYSVKKFKAGARRDPSKDTIRRCRKCGRKFRTYPSEVKTGRKYCSVLCARSRPAPNKKHGLSNTRIHNIWCGMNGRCRAKKGLRYEHYARRGIKVCHSWKRNFMAFRDWALRNGYRHDLELDRKRSRGNYSPGNCRWVTRTRQMQNTSKRRNAKTSRFKGVSHHSQNDRWRAQIVVNRQPISLGCFGTQKEAAKSYDKAARRFFGEFSNTNFKED